jgi:putative oxidoreductase
MATNANVMERIGVMFVRIAVGVVFFMHGYQKWFTYKPQGVVDAFGKMGLPPAAAYATMTAELVCGALLILGFLTRIAVIPIIVVMTVAILHVHLKNGFFLDKMGYEYALTLGLAGLGILFAGPGLLAVDNLLD